MSHRKSSRLDCLLKGQCRQRRVVAHAGEAREQENHGQQEHGRQRKEGESPPSACSSTSSRSLRPDSGRALLQIDAPRTHSLLAFLLRFTETARRLPGRRLAAAAPLG
jgi:hypothetical protein